MTETYKKAAMEVLNATHLYAVQNSGCEKVEVGSAIVRGIALSDAVFGANRTLPCSCKKEGCMRVKKYGDNSKQHRNPEDCRAVHSEIDAISRAARQGFSTEATTIFVTRYPCEACARAIVRAGIKHVIYGRQQECSEESMRVFRAAGVEVYHMKEWDAPDVNY